MSLTVTPCLPDCSKSYELLNSFGEFFVERWGIAQGMVE